MKLRARVSAVALALLSAQASAQEPPLTTKCASAPLMAAFNELNDTGRMPQRMIRFMSDVEHNKVEPQGDRVNL